MILDSKRRYSRAITAIFLIAALSACFDRESKQESVAPYDETVDAEQEIASALAGLEERQRVLLVFGANWCPDCRRVDASLLQPEISGFLRREFTLVKVDVGNFDKNLEITERYGSPTRQGIPALAILDRHHAVTRIVFGKELAKAHKKGREPFYRWVKSL